MAGLPEPPEPAGFGNCGECAYQRTGTAELCFECASDRMEDVAWPRCLTCDGRLRGDDRCGNPLCNRSDAQRGWKVIYAIAMRSGRLQHAISAYKYDDRFGWGWIFGRILVGYLDSLPELFEDYDLIVPMPTYVGPGGRSWDHIAFILERAAMEGPHWPFCSNVIIKTEATQQLVGKNFAQRAAIVEGELRPALTVTDPDAVKGKNVLVFDDVFTGGLTLREVAFKLRAAGADSVAGLVLARQPFGG